MTEETTEFNEWDEEVTKVDAVPLPPMKSAEWTRLFAELRNQSTDDSQGKTL